MPELLPSVEWTRPGALWTLLAPLILWLVSLRPERPEPVPVGTFDLWREVGGEAGGERRRRRLPPSRWLLLGALVCGALGLAGPRQRRPTPPRRWVVVVDPSPSMFVEHRELREPAGSGGKGDTRLARGLELLEGFLSSPGEGPVILEWVRPGPGKDDHWRGPVPPPDWNRPPVPARREPLWARYDEPGFLWLTDRVPDIEPLRAGVIATGGGPAFGPVATVADRRLVWNGEGLGEEPGVEPRVLVLEGELPEPLTTLARLWAEDRGLGIDVRDGGSGADGADVALRLVGGGTGPPVPAPLARDGWSAEGRVRRAPSLGEAGPLETWLGAPVDGRPLPVVTWAPGEVHVALASLSEPRGGGDPAAFPVSWAALLDGAVLPAPGVVPLGERAPAGPPLIRPPAVLGVDDPSPSPPPWPLVTLLAAAAAALGFLSLVLGGGRAGGA